MKYDTFSPPAGALPETLVFCCAVARIKLFEVMLDKLITVFDAVPAATLTMPLRLNVPCRSPARRSRSHCPRAKRFRRGLFRLEVGSAEACLLAR
jgi:hypothetical protein